MIIYQDTEKELFMTDYKPLPPLRGLPLPELYGLVDNLEKAQENAWLYGNDLLALAIDNDIRKTDIYIKMNERKAAKQ